MIEADYIVYRPGPQSGDLGVIERVIGTWYDLSGMKPSQESTLISWPSPTSAVIATPTDRFEFRDDGACAQVWELSRTEYVEEEVE